MYKVVLITGASTGIGRACAEIFAARGHKTILTGRREQSLLDLQKYLSDAYCAQTLVSVLDVRDVSAVQAFVGQLSEEWQKIDILINNAGLALGLTPIDQGNTEFWDRMIDTNIKGLLYVSRSVSEIMVRQGAGHIINIGSIAGKEAYANGNVYSATKFAVDGLSKGMRIDLAMHGIKVSEINPGAVETEFSLIRFEGDGDRASAVYKGFTPLDAKDVAETVYFVASRPAHVNINEITIMPLAQASASTIYRKETQ